MLATTGAARGTVFPLKTLPREDGVGEEEEGEEGEEGQEGEEGDPLPKGKGGGKGGKRGTKRGRPKPKPHPVVVDVFSVFDVLVE